MSARAMARGWQRRTGLYIARAPIDRPPSVCQPAESSTLTAPTGPRPAPAIAMEPSSSPCNRAQSTPPSDLTRRGRHEAPVSTAFRTRQDCGEQGKLTVAVQRVHASKRLLAAITGVRTQVEVQGLVPLAIMLAGKTLFATRPLALEWSLLVVRSQMTYQQTTLRVQS